MSKPAVKTIVLRRAILGQIEMPPGLSHNEANVWKSTVPLLKETGILSTIDADLLASYCKVTAEKEAAAKRFQDASASLMVCFHSYMRLQKKAHRMGNALMLSPKARTSSKAKAVNR